MTYPRITTPAEELNRLRDQCYEASKANGWHEGPPKSFGEYVALFHSEASEAFEEYRDGHDETELYYSTDKNGNAKPEGIPSEIADGIIRYLDYCGARGIDIGEVVQIKLAYNATRGHRHGGKVI